MPGWLLAFRFGTVEFEISPRQFFGQDLHSTRGRTEEMFSTGIVRRIGDHQSLRAGILIDRQRVNEETRTVRELSLSYGVYAERIDIPPTTDGLVKAALKQLLDEKLIEMNDIIVFIGGGHIYSAHTNFLQVDTPATLLK